MVKFADGCYLERAFSPLFGDARLTRPQRLATALLLAALARLAIPCLVADAVAQTADTELAAKPVSLPDMALGPAQAPVTVIEYASMTCPHCADFEQNVFPMLKSKYIDSGKVRFVFREFPLDEKAAAASMVARCIGGDNPDRFFAAIDLLFKQQDQLIEHTVDTLTQIGRLSGLDQQAVERCGKDQALLDKIKADENFGYSTLKVEATPTFFINGEKLKGAMTFEEIDGKIGALLKR
jgi:protein-disulfide isomerase